MLWFLVLINSFIKMFIALNFKVETCCIFRNDKILICDRCDDGPGMIQSIWSVENVEVVAAVDGKIRHINMVWNQ